MRTVLDSSEMSKSFALYLPIRLKKQYIYDRYTSNNRLQLSWNREFNDGISLEYKTLHVIMERYLECTTFLHQQMKVIRGMKF